MNFSKPTENKPALLTLDEVETFLHEFGHSLHGIFANTTYSSLSGTNVYWDFVELPSQFMENYSIEKDFLNTFAVHYQTGEQIPQELIDRITQSRNFNAAYACMRQVCFGLLDIAFYTLT
jgi:peptidyl-dipeptidase Dcp